MAHLDRLDSLAAPRVADGTTGSVSGGTGDMELLYLVSAIAPIFLSRTMPGKIRENAYAVFRRCQCHSRRPNQSSAKSFAGCRKKVIRVTSDRCLAICTKSLSVRKSPSPRMNIFRSMQGPMKTQFGCDIGIIPAWSSPSCVRSQQGALTVLSEHTGRHFKSQL